MKLQPLIALIIAVLLISTCTTSLTGNSSETSNGVTVVARAGGVEGCAPPHSRVFFIPASYKPLDPKMYDSALTDTSGKFLFEVPDGDYNLFCYGSDGLSAMMQLSVNTSDVYGDTLFKKLSVPGSIKGTIPFADEDPGLSYFFIEGSMFFTQADPDGHFYLDSIPEGIYTLKHFSVSSIKTNQVVSHESTSLIKVSSDSLTVIKWRSQ
jgi:hypothetical protein